MMGKPAMAWRKRALEACATIARCVSVTDQGVVHTVQRMQQDAAFRQMACAQALQRTKPMDGDKSGAVAYLAVQKAVDLLRQHEGKKL